MVNIEFCLTDEFTDEFDVPDYFTSRHVYNISAKQPGRSDDKRVLPWYKKFLYHGYISDLQYVHYTKKIQLQWAAFSDFMAVASQF